MKATSKSETDKQREFWRPFDRDFIENPYPYYEQLRKLGPVYITNQNEWVFTRYQDVKTLYKHPACDAGNRVKGLTKLEEQGKTETSFKTLLEATQDFLVFKNPPEHTALRKFIASSWTDRSVGALIEHNISYLINRCDADEFDYVKEIAEPLPALTMAGILGIPPNDYPELIEKSRVLFRSFDMYLTLRDLRDIQQAVLEMSEYFDFHLNQKKKKPDDSLMSQLLHLNPGYQQQELVHTCMFLFMAGEETTTGLLSLGLKNLVPYWSDLRNANSFNSKIIDELLRYDSPIQVVARLTTQPIQLGDIKIPENSKLALSLGSANHDETVFKNPEHLIFDRDSKHLAFGTGIHHCMGDWLAKAEGITLFSRLMEKYNKIEIAMEPVFRHNLTFRSLSSLMVKVSTN